MTPGCDGTGVRPLRPENKLVRLAISGADQFQWFLLAADLSMSIAQNIAVVRSRIAAAAQRAGRSPEAIALMAVSKTVPPAAIREAYAGGAPAIR